MLHHYSKTSSRRSKYPPIALIFLISLFGCTASSYSESVRGPANSPWPLYRHDLQHTGRTNLVAPEYPTIRWNLPISVGFSSPVIGQNNTIYTGSFGKLFSLNSDGTLRWSYNVQAVINSAPALTDFGLVLFGAYDNYLTALSTSAGNLQWRYRTFDYIEAAPLIAPDNSIYVASWDDWLHKVDIGGNGNRLFYTADDLRGAPALNHNGRVCFGDYNSTIYALNADGSIHWRYRNPTAVNYFPSPAIGQDNSVYIGGTDSYFYAINGDGTLKWSYLTGNRINGAAALGTDGTCYFTSQDSKLYAIQSNGVLQWSFTTGGNLTSSPVVDGRNRIYFGGSDTNLYCLNADGSLHWTMTLGSIANEVAIGIENWMFVGTSSQLFALSFSPTPTVTPTSSPTLPPTPTQTASATPTPTQQPTGTPTRFPTTTPTSSPTSTPTITSTITPTDTPTVTLTPTVTRTSTPTMLPSWTPSQTPTGTPTFTNIPTASPTRTPTSSPTDHPTETATGTPTQTPSFTATPSTTPSRTPTRTPTFTPTGTSTPTSTQTALPTSTPSRTPTQTPTQSPTLTPTGTATNMPTFTPSLTPTMSPTTLPTQTPTASPTQTPSPTSLPTSTPSPTGTPSGTPTGSPTPTATFTGMPTATGTSTPTYSPTGTPTEMPTFTGTATPTSRPTATPTHTGTAPPTGTPTASPSVTPTYTPTMTPTPSRTSTPSPTVTPTPTSTKIADIYFDIYHDTDTGDNLSQEYIQFKKLLESDRHSVREGNALLDFNLIAPYRYVVLMDPDVGFGYSEIDALDRYIMFGGIVVCAGEARDNDSVNSNLNKLTQRFEVTINDDIVKDASQHDNLPEFPVVTDFAAHPVLDLIPATGRLHFYESASLLCSGCGRGLAFMTANGVSEGGSQTQNSPIPLMAYSSRSGAGGALIVFGDASIWDNNNDDADTPFNISEEENSTLVLSVFRWTPAPGDPCATPTPSPTAEAAQPMILMAGYMDTHLSMRQGGHLTMLALVSDTPPSVVNTVEVFVSGVPTGVYLDDSANPNAVFILPAVDLGPGLPVQSMLLELQATGSLGVTSTLWPYLSVSP